MLASPFGEDSGSMQYQIRNTDDFAHVVRSLRHDQQLTQRTLADRAGVSPKWVSDVESGKSSLRFTTVLALLDTLGVDLTLHSRARPSIDLDELLGLSDKSQNDLEPVKPRQ